MMCDDCRWAAAHPAAAAQFDDEGHAKCSALGQGRCTCQHRGTPYAVNADRDRAAGAPVRAGAIAPADRARLGWLLRDALRRSFPGQR
ncbi:hypothetical protein [Streptomyces atriruber]|uniref:hypothetical protein n=1 Tax=Streptomyces atriruber TaxID=545121 RepID=UPI0006E3934C|nr:hypothetical protein [Streptomyces atriruber]